MPASHVLDRGVITLQGRRGVVMSHPGTADCFRRRLARLGNDAPLAEPAAALAALADRLLRPAATRDRSECPAPAAARANS